MTSLVLSLSCTSFFFVCLFVVCIQSLRYLLVLAKIGNLVSWSDHLMTYVNRLMDQRGRILCSAE